MDIFNLIFGILTLMTGVYISILITLDKKHDNDDIDDDNIRRSDKTIRHFKYAQNMLIVLLIYYTIRLGIAILSK